MASRWSDIFEREPEHEPELGPSNETGPQPDSWFADKVEDVPPMQATQAPQPEAEFQDGIEVEEEVILCAGLLPGAQIAERAGGLSPSCPGPRWVRRAPGGWQHQRFWMSSSLLGLAPGPSRSRRRLLTLGAARGPGSLGRP